MNKQYLKNKDHIVSVGEQFKRWSEKYIVPQLHRGERGIDQLFHLPITYFKMTDKKDSRHPVFHSRYDLNCYIEPGCFRELIGTGDTNFEVVGFVYYGNSLEIIIKQNYAIA